MHKTSVLICQFSNITYYQIIKQTTLIETEQIFNIKLMYKKSSIEKWLSSKQAKSFLNCSDCELMHLRQERKLRYQKKGIAFLYAIEDLEIQREKRS